MPSFKFVVYKAFVINEIPPPEYSERGIQSFYLGIYRIISLCVAAKVEIYFRFCKLIALFCRSGMGGLIV